MYLLYLIIAERLYNLSYLKLCVFDLLANLVLFLISSSLELLFEILIVLSTALLFYIIKM
jgi:hypothetical protein